MDGFKNTFVTKSGRVSKRITNNFFKSKTREPSQQKENLVKDAIMADAALQQRDEQIRL